MPAASVFFRDPDGHLLEYLAMLDEDPSPDLGIVSWSEWLAHREPHRSLRWNARESKNPNQSYNRASHDKQSPRSRDL
jgi:hypothetical protein